jgi:UDPglucose--hexose-1-phosphate uridylyltransferase
MAQNNKKQKMKFPSELRLDMVSNDWVVIATGRARRPETFKQRKREIKEIPGEKCAFCQISSQKDPTLIFSQGKRFVFKGWKSVPKDWTIIVIPNKYPAFFPYPKLDKKIEGGLYQKMNAAGFHEVVITRSHKKHMGKFSIKELKEVFDAYQARYLDLVGKKFVNHIFIFHNHGPSAGASIAHPHSQIITTPLIDADLQNALSRSRNYLKMNNECVYCRMNKWEMKFKKRIIFENKKFIAVCPFASKTAFQVIISPKKHLAYFERITEEEKWELSEAFKAALGKLHKGLNDPDYNFYLHTAPCDGGDYDYYHWHWTILPKTSTWAGFEIEARMEISTIEPEKAAAYLRKQ